ncbi:hypothetical protein E1301_Tti005583 [Triplophysa tibetana]|uniref:Uncharacterized protein n=1 Tax=Triplophysa tibetana TaxID=1572043 RepID=A0A5A9NHM3_9TELE|nr:hypothetical protein E1301_Tti005583 [Triplophysa tibetana]
MNDIQYINPEGPPSVDKPDPRLQQGPVSCYHWGDLEPVWDPNSPSSVMGRVLTAADLRTVSPRDGTMRLFHIEHLLLSSQPPECGQPRVIQACPQSYSSSETAFIYVLVSTVTQETKDSHPVHAGIRESSAQS